MRDSSAIPVRRVAEPSKAKDQAKFPSGDSVALAAVSLAGPRKLIRPRLPEGTPTGRYPTRVSAITPLKPRMASAEATDSHAEVFYFQKQIQGQTLMVFVLDDGEQIEGQIEWFDRDAIKVRRGGLRTLIYKAAIKYLYKASDRARG